MVKDDLGNIHCPIGGYGVSPLLQLVLQPFAYLVIRLRRPGPEVDDAADVFVL